MGAGTPYILGRHVLPRVTPLAVAQFVRAAHVAADIAIRRPPLRVPLVEGAGVQVAEEILRRRVKVLRMAEVDRAARIATNKAPAAEQTA